MTSPALTAGRIGRPAVVLVLLLLLLGLTVPAHATGTGGIDLSPYPGVADGKQITAFHVKVPASGDLKVQYALRNTTDRTAAARVFAARAERGDHGFTIGAAGSSPYLALTDQRVALRPRETRIASFTVHADDGKRPKDEVYGALVVEVRNGSVIQQAATVVYLQPGRVVPLPVLVVLVAVALLALSGLGFLVVVRRRRSV